MTRIANYAVALGLLAAAWGCGDTLNPADPDGVARATSAVLDEACAGCVINHSLVRSSGPPDVTLLSFAADPAADYRLEIIERGDRGSGRTGLVAHVTLNDADIVVPASIAGNHHISMSVQATLRDANAMSVRLMGRPGAVLDVRIRSGAREVGATGGTVTAPGGARLEIPAGVVDAPAVIQVVQQEDEQVPLGAEAAGPVYDLLPDGLRFTRPVDLIIPVPAGVQGRAAAAIYGELPEEDVLLLQPTAWSADGAALVARLNHFSRYRWLVPTPFSPSQEYTWAVTNRPDSRRWSGTRLPMTQAEAALEAEHAVAEWLGHLREVGVSLGQGSSAAADVWIKFDPDVDIWGGTDLDGIVGIERTTGRRILFLDDNVSWYTLAELEDEVEPTEPAAASLHSVLQHEWGHVLGAHHVWALICDTPEGKANDERCEQPPVMAPVLDRFPTPALRCQDLTMISMVYGTIDPNRCATDIRATTPMAMEGLPGRATQITPKVVVVDANNRAISGVVVRFRTVPTGSRVDERIVITDFRGEATPGAWILSPGEGSVDSLIASVDLGELGTDSVTFSATSNTPDPPLIVRDDFSNELASWTNATNTGTWTIDAGGRLVGEYNISCGGTTCSQSDLLLRDDLQPPPNSDWRAKVDFTQVRYPFSPSFDLTYAHAVFSLWASPTEKHQVGVGYETNGVAMPTTLTTAQVNHQSYFPWAHRGPASGVSVPPWNPAGMNTATLEKRGNTYTLSLNGTTVHTFTATFSSGPKIGLHIYGKCIVDNFELTPL